jgi:hypothetical protein
METLKLSARMVGAALILAVLLNAGVGLTESAVAQGSAGVSWQAQAQNGSSQTDTTQTYTDRSQQHSSDGQDLTDDQTYKGNQDGSSVEHQDIEYSDGKGDSASSHQDDQTDSNGNRSVHHEETTTDQNGNCQMLITDDVYDSHGNLTKHTEKTVPCADFSLQVSLKGSATIGDLTTTWGPNTAVIHLEKNGNTYEGSYSGEFDSSLEGGECVGSGTYPVVIKVTAKEDEFQDLDFSVQKTMSATLGGSCGSGSGSESIPAGTSIRTFTLPAVDGASNVYNYPMSGIGYLTLTYTLKKAEH